MNKKAQVAETITWVFAFILIFVIMVIFTFASVFLYSVKVGAEEAEGTAPIWYQQCVTACNNHNLLYFCCQKNEMIFKIEGVSVTKNNVCNKNLGGYTLWKYCWNMNCEEVNCAIAFKQ
jgi:cytochrome c oxidase assembly protein Cox11